jgi:hypothetical protein
MNHLQVITNHAKLAEDYFAGAGKLLDGNYAAETALAQAQATLGVGHAILALVQHFQGGSVPISPEWVNR